MKKNHNMVFVLSVIFILIILGIAYINYKNTKACPSWGCGPAPIKNISQQSNTQTQQSENTNANGNTISPNNVAVSENESVIQGILNTKALLLSGDAVKIRAYLQAEYSDNPKFFAQAKSADDKTLLATATLLSNVLKGIDATFLRTNCKITIVGNTAKCSWSLGLNSTKSLTVKKINGVWQ
jgi:hypothetical protein